MTPVKVVLGIVVVLGPVGVGPVVAVVVRAGVLVLNVVVDVVVDVVDVVVVVVVVDVVVVVVVVGGTYGILSRHTAR